MHGLFTAQFALSFMAHESNGFILLSLLMLKHRAHIFHLVIRHTMLECMKNRILFVFIFKRQLLHCIEIEMASQNTI